MALLGAIMFSAKAVLAKLIYREIEIPVTDVLAFRMLFALPFYLGIFWIQWRKRQKVTEAGLKSGKPLTAKHYWAAIGLGLLGYYVSSFLDFTGLKYISAGLERIILFSYPTLVLLFGALFYKTRIQGYQWLALLLSYAGIAISFAADLSFGNVQDTIIGSILILFCSLTFGLYVLWSGRLIPRMGAAWFTSVGMLAASAAIFIHYFLFGSSFSLMMGLSPKVYLYLFLMGIFSTVLPTLLVSAALKRIGSSNLAIVSSIGPMATIFLAFFFLQEPVGVTHLIGAGLVITGVLVTGRRSMR
jgi:drug/metabolite transporter (DMT)-like permease